MKISVIGCGYLGAVHAACMATLGHDVIGVDVDPQRVDMLAAGQVPFYEPGFPEVLAQALDSGRLSFALAPAAEAIADADVHFIAVGTPQSAEGTAADMRYVDAAAQAILDALPDGPDGGKNTVVVGKSTVPVGTAQRLYERFAQRDAALVWNPEFLREGTAVQDTLRPDRIVYGLPSSSDATSAAHARRGKEALDAVYAPLLEAGIPQVVTDFSTAELVKVAANSFLATKISFINAMAELCERTGGDVTQLAEAIGHDVRIGNQFLKAGVGFGGGCLPKDIRAFATRAAELGCGDSVGFLREVDAINLRRRQRVVEEALAGCGGDVAGKKIAVLGAAFKANSDDIRDSPAVDIARRLLAEGAELAVYDPQAGASVRREYPDVPVVDSAAEALAGAEMTLLLTEWQEFRELDPATAGELVARRCILDGRNLLSPEVWAAAGWQYVGMGRGGSFVGARV
ncbi:UDP-glucose 6-dehydrogenase YwqF [Corynebacterium urogenitale]|uniref:UDP-glucose 6-dehydrogenase n=1 Tax=Corynebacterium urogenitale TaxID=2487892 RepID=A0A5J6Z3C8_9CORY|nr:UDP-glucose/GDP-mannose dehydrogenase family protein [Corynebacterium urogenitale]QFQ01484.1 UDP-glucose 6-dehydrogenase YwqF [Corynebacterium urogenitale]